MTTSISLSLGLPFLKILWISGTPTHVNGILILSLRFLVLMLLKPSPTLLRSPLISLTLSDGNQPAKVFAHPNMLSDFLTHSCRFSYHRTDPGAYLQVQCTSSTGPRNTRPFLLTLRSSAGVWFEGRWPQVRGQQGIPTKSVSIARTVIYLKMVLTSFSTALFLEQSSSLQIPLSVLLIYHRNRTVCRSSYHIFWTPKPLESKCNSS